MHSNLLILSTTWLILSRNNWLAQYIVGPRNANFYPRPSLPSCETLGVIRFLFTSPRKGSARCDIFTDGSFLGLFFFTCFHFFRFSDRYFLVGLDPNPVNKPPPAGKNITLLTPPSSPPAFCVVRIFFWGGAQKDRICLEIPPFRDETESNLIAQGLLQCIS